MESHRHAAPVASRCVRRVCYVCDTAKSSTVVILFQHLPTLWSSTNMPHPLFVHTCPTRSVRCPGSYRRTVLLCFSSLSLTRGGSQENEGRLREILVHMYIYIYVCMHTYVCVCVFIYMHIHVDFGAVVSCLVVSPSRRNPKGEGRLGQIVVDIFYNIHVYVHTKVYVYMCMYIYVDFCAFVSFLLMSPSRRNSRGRRTFSKDRCIYIHTSIYIYIHMYVYV